MRQALDDVVQRRIELVVLRAQLLFLELEQLVLLLELRMQLEELGFSPVVVEGCAIEGMSGIAGALPP